MACESRANHANGRCAKPGVNESHITASTIIKINTSIHAT